MNGITLEMLNGPLHLIISVATAPTHSIEMPNLVPDFFFGKLMISLNYEEMSKCLQGNSPTAQNLKKNKKKGFLST